MDSYYYLKYPICAIKKPFSFRKEGFKTYLQKTKSTEEKLIDDLELDGDTFVSRNAQIIPPTNFRFCPNVSALIFNGCNYGIDRDGDLKSFRIDHKYTRRHQKVLGVEDGGVEVEGIPYLIILPVPKLDKVVDLYCDLQLAAGKFRISRFYNIDLDGEIV